MTKTKKSWGGARLNAGRPKSKIKKISLTIRISEKLLQYIDSNKGDLSRSQYIEAKLQK